MADNISTLPPGDGILEEHLGYALDLLAMSLKEIGESPYDDEWREWYRRMSIIEVFWSQARILVEFFTGTLASSTTAAAGHFTKTEITYEFPGASQLKDKRNDQIAHMNYARTTDEDLKLQQHEMYQTSGAIKRALLAFEANLKDDQRKIWNERRTGRQLILPDLIYVSGTFSACAAGPIALQTTGYTSGFQGTGPGPHER
ncbi:MAG: hypothetical protein K5821_05480 [Nitrobacter sp.]|uniref:hypothetical protein n=1 Tax=Nitrobacter sp. TaxID=29420 RepID=UPI002631C146|nr:hypothetical protein [Nitrobacter sp.]MCV0385869.1 hypothetical protein [Nitrobacter sp.]